MLPLREVAVASQDVPGISVAAIDVGSNALRMTIGRLKPGRTLEVVCDEREPARLGQEVFRTGELSSKARETVMEALSRFGSILRRHKPDFVRAVATSALREASN